MTPLESVISELMNLYHEGYIIGSSKQGATAQVKEAFEKLDEARKRTDWNTVYEHTY